VRDVFDLSASDIMVAFSLPKLAPVLSENEKKKHKSVTIELK
jgi:hypothetical protein